MSQSYRVWYYTSENKLGKSGLWFSASTKDQFKTIMNRYHINPDNVLSFEMKKDGVYKEIQLEKFRQVFK